MNLPKNISFPKNFSRNQILSGIGAAGVLVYLLTVFVTALVNYQAHAIFLLAGFAALVLFQFLSDRQIQSELKLLGLPAKGNRSMDDVHTLLNRHQNLLALKVLRELRPELNLKDAKKELGQIILLRRSLAEERVRNGS